MPLPPKVHADVRKRFETLITEAESMLKIAQEGEIAKRARQRGGLGEMQRRLTGGGPVPRPPTEPPFPAGWDTAEETYFELRTKALSLLTFLGADHHSNLQKHGAEIMSGGWCEYSVQRILGILRALLSDLDAGMLESIAARVEAELTADYLGQAERLLDETKAAKNAADRVPAAVLAGAVLENALKVLCQRQTPPIPLTTPKGGHKMLNGLIDDVKNAGVYNELQAKELRAFADIRNAAAHGDFDKFDRAQVERMLQGVQSFLAKHL